MLDSTKRVGPAWHSTLLLAMLAGAGGGLAAIPGDLSPPAAETSPLPVRTFELQRRGRPLIGIDLNGLAFAIDPEWTRLAAPAKDGKVQLFDVASGEPAGPPLDGGFGLGGQAFVGGPFTFTFTSNGKLLVWNWGKKVVVWQVDSREILLKQEVDDLKAGVSVAPGGRFLAWSTDKSTVVWDTSSRSVSTRLEGRLCDFSPDGRLLALAGSLWDYEYARLLKKPVGGSIWDLERGQPLVENLGGLCHGFSPDGRYMVVESTTGTALWDVSGVRALPAFRHLTDRVRRMIIDRPVWSANGRFLAFANGDLDVEVWDLEAVPPTHRILQEREIRYGGRACSPWLLLSHDGGLLSDACWVTDLWDLSQPAPRRMLRTGLILGPPIMGPVGGRPSVLSRDGRTLAYTWGSGRRLLGGGDAGFGLWDVARGRAAGPRVKVRDLARMQFSPDGRLLATSGWGPGADGKGGPFVQLWSVEAIRAAGEGEMPDGQPAAK
jgi:WD40 repeat protein